MSKYLKVTKEQEASTSSNEFCVTLILRCGEREEVALEKSAEVKWDPEVEATFMPC